MDYFVDFFLPRLAKSAPEFITLIEAIAAGYKICHPVYLDGNSLKHGLVYADARDLSQNTVPTTTLASIGTSLRNPSLETSSLTRISNCGRQNIVCESITGKEEIDISTLLANIDTAIQGLDDLKSNPYLNELIQIFRSKDESRRSKSLISLFNYAITGKRKHSFADSKYVYETENKVILCSIRLSNHYSSNNVIREEENKFKIHPVNRLSLVAPDTRKTEQVSNQGGEVNSTFDCLNPITKTEIVINPSYIKLEQKEPTDTLRNIIKATLQNLRLIFSTEVQHKDMMGEIAISLSKEFNSIIDVYQIDDNGMVLRNGKPYQKEK